jgi:dienelactone hydrolase
MKKYAVQWKIPIMVLLSLTLIGACQSPTNLNNMPGSNETGFVEFEFPTRDVDGFKELVSGDKSFNETGAGKLYLPKNATVDQPVPMMIILHGSGGTWGGRGHRHARYLNKHGIGALLIDTYASRGLIKKDKYVRRLMKVNLPDQISDAFAALKALQNHPLVDGGRIGVMGYSMGGLTALLTSFESIAQASGDHGLRFDLHVGFYAPCLMRPQDTRRTGAPIVALWGELDKATPKARCDDFIAELKKRPGVVETVWYPGAAHGWNGLQPAKFYKGVPNFAPCDWLIHPDGHVTDRTTGLISETDKQLISNSERCVSFGYVIGRHEQTHKLANQALIEAIRRHMPQKDQS